MRLTAGSIAPWPDCLLVHVRVLVQRLALCAVAGSTLCRQAWCCAMTPSQLQ
jgi:hypothetical protein